MTPRTPALAESSVPPKIAKKHPLETGRGWTKIALAADLVAKNPRTIFRWIQAGYIRVEKVRRSTFVNVEDLMATEAAIASGLTPDTPGRKVQSADNDGEAEAMSQ